LEYKDYGETILLNFKQQHIFNFHSGNLSFIFGIQQPRYKDLIVAKENILGQFAVTILCLCD